MELSCTENPSAVNFAQKDPTIFRDVRVIENLLKDESMYVCPCDYFTDVQVEIQPYMRNVVATWMMEVCEEQMCEEQVFPLAVNYMDRFLCVCVIKRQQLQLLGATCLLIASKIRSSTILTIDLLRAYTDYSITHSHITSWELLVLSKLQWNAAGITGFDYIDQITDRFAWGSESSYLRRHAHTLVSICYTEPALIQVTPSLIASACICAAMRGLRMSSTDNATMDICNLLNIDLENLESLRIFIDQAVERGIPSTTEKTSTYPNPNSCSNSAFESPKYGQPETPPEVENVHF
ncbi:hypothetical protein RN001_003537 [Aquatica leii]|uniref:Uncharacterized protein n=1 Tax=Aquatica leii TaxID=1421715 RepID=A0AAN7SE25_9COLE|nr:hypothetical protein RN001_003537 [Aquatica leii]